MRTLAALAASAALILVAATEAVALTCKHESASSNIECTGRVPAPWIYDSSNHYGGNGPHPSNSLSEAAANAIAEIAGYFGSNFCSYDYQVVDVPWAAVTWNGGFSSYERKQYYLEGTAWYTQSPNPPCTNGVQQRVQIDRTRNVFCPAGWSPGSSAAQGFYCYRVDHFPPPPRCSAPCPSGAPGNQGAGARDPGYVGNPVFAHTGDKFHTEVDWTSGGHRPLTLSRNYLSAGFPRLMGTGIANYGLGTYWRTRYDARLASYADASITTKVALRVDGSTLYFYRNGTNWTSRTEQSERLADRLDGTGAVVGWTLTTAEDVVEEYDLLGRLTSIADRDGWRQELAYGPNGLLATVTDALGRELAFAYDADGWLTSVTTPDGAIQYDIDVFGYLATVSHPGGAQRQYRYMEPGYVASTSRTGLLTGILDENGDRYATFRYDANGRAWSTEHGNGANRYTFAWGSTNSVTDPLGTTRTVAKTTVKGFVRTVGLSQACPSCGKEANVSTSTFDANGNVTSRTSFTGKKTCYAYDTTRNLETARLEGATSAENCTTVLATPPNRPDVRKVTTTWHATWRLPATITEPAPGGTKTTTFAYDASGNLIQKSVAAPKNDGSGTTITRTWSWTYGTLGRVLTATDPNGKVTTTTWHSDTDPDPGKRGQVATMTNPLGHVTQYTAYDAGNRLTSMTDPNGLVTAMTYDARGRLTSRSVGGETTTYDYDLAGQLTDVELPDGAILHYVYDAAHRLTEVHDGLGNKIVYTLDGMGNRTAEQAFDPQGVLARTRTRVYDSLNRLSQDVGALGQATVHTYDGNGNRLTTTDPLTHVTTNTCDALDRLLTVTQPSGLEK